MDNILSQKNFDTALKRKGWTQTELIRVYDNKYNTDTGKSIEGTIKNWRTPKANPTIYLLARVCNLLDCDIDYLLGVQDTPRKEYAHIAEMTGLSYTAVENLLNAYENKDPIIEILSDLLDNEEVLQKIYSCASSDYGSISGIVEIPDAFGGHSTIYRPKEVRKADSMELYDTLCTFIDNIRAQYGLPTSKEI